MVSEFDVRVISALKKIPKGKITTYGLLAKAIGKPKATRAVGSAVGRNPYAPKVPCHRVVKSDGSVGGYASGTKKKVELLEEEGIVVNKGRIVDFEKKVFSFH